MKVEISHYFCDTCKTELTKIEHIHIEDIRWFGIVKPPKFEMKDMNERYFDFCNLECFEKFIEPKKKEAKKKTVKK